jgi:hypothetical protein
MQPSSRGWPVWSISISPKRHEVTDGSALASREAFERSDVHTRSVARLGVLSSVPTPATGGTSDEDHAAIPDSGVPARLLRELPTQGVVTTVRESVRKRQRAKPEATRDWLLDFGFETIAHEGSAPVGRRGYSDAFLAEIAAMYVAASERGSRPLVEVASFLAERHQVSKSPATIDQYVRAAHDEGIADSGRARSRTQPNASSQDVGSDEASGDSTHGN